jgi:putative exosortase-associated protein (TIGR04073 family)
MIRRLVAVGVVLMMAAGPAFASRPMDDRPLDITDDILARTQLRPPLNKLGRGVANFFTGWLEVPWNIKKEYDTHDTAASLMTGTGIGIIKGAVRTGVGLYEALTFWLPYPPRFEPVLPTLGYFDKRKEPPSLLSE